MSIYMSTLEVITNSYNTLANASIKDVNQRVFRIVQIQWFIPNFCRCVAVSLSICLFDRLNETIAILD